MAQKRDSTSRQLTALPVKNRQLYNAFFNLAPVDLNDPDAVQERTDLYREYVTENDVAPLWADYGFCLGFTRQYLYAIISGTRGHRLPKKTIDILNRTHMWLEASLSQVGLENPQKSIMTIWLQKNNFGYSDKLEISPPTPEFQEKPSIEEVIARHQFILDSVPHDENPQLAIGKPTKELQTESVKELFNRDNS